MKKELIRLANHFDRIGLVKEANYRIEENTPLCLLGKNYVGFFKKQQKRGN